jgi:hypothetical protein
MIIKAVIAKPSADWGGKDAANKKLPILRPFWISHFRDLRYAFLQFIAKLAFINQSSVHPV